MICPICKSHDTFFFAEKKSYIFYRCVSCKSLYLTSIPPEKQLSTYYSRQFSYTDGLVNETIIRRRSTIILTKLRHLSPYSGSICDVGSGYGFFLDQAQKNGFKVLGIEPSKQLVDYACSHFSIPSFKGTLADYLHSDPKQFDIVTCIHVLEHITHPDIFISNLLRLVKPGGILFIETPNSDSHLLYAEKHNYTFLIPPEHVWLFSRYSFIYLLPKTTDIVYVNTYSYSEHLMGILKKMKDDIHRVILSDSVYIRRIYIGRSFGLSPQDDSRASSRMIQKNNIYKIGSAIRKNFSYFLIDRLLAPLFTGILNVYHKGSILELYIRKK